MWNNGKNNSNRKCSNHSWYIIYNTMKRKITKVLKVNGKGVIKCNICNKKRLLKFYYLTSKGGYMSQCKSCFLIRDKQYKNQTKGVL